MQVCESPNSRPARFFELGDGQRIAWGACMPLHAYFGRQKVAVQFRTAGKLYVRFGLIIHQQVQHATVNYKRYKIYMQSKTGKLAEAKNGGVFRVHQVGRQVRTHDISVQSSTMLGKA